jgi:threonine/homoserine efflux transporter RhtA
VRQSAIADSVWVALVVFGVRLVAIMSGSWLGCNLGGVKSELQRRCFWMSMVTQVST